MAVYGPKVRSVGSSSYPLRATGAHIFKRDYYESLASTGDVRGEYQDLKFSGSGSGETLRVRAIVNYATAAAGGTINGIHATARIADGMGTPTGAANAIRATIESAHADPSGTFAAIQLESNIVTGATLPTQTAFMRVSNTGLTDVTNLLYFDEVDSASATKLVCTPHNATAPTTASHAIKVNVAGTIAWIYLFSDSPAG